MTYTTYKMNVVLKNVTYIVTRREATVKNQKKVSTLFLAYVLRVDLELGLSHRVCQNQSYRHLTR